MAYIFHLIIIIFAVSVDGFTVGFTYGLRKISITTMTLFIIMFCSGLVVFLSMSAGKLIREVLSPYVAQYIGGIIFICLGTILLFSLFKSSSKTEQHEKKRPNKHSYSAVMKDPTIVDYDQSGTISVGESFVLGIALAFDAFGAGFAAAVLGYSPLFTACFIAISSGFFLYFGIKIGIILARLKWIKRLTILPPILLILIGFASLI